MNNFKWNSTSLREFAIRTLGIIALAMVTPLMAQVAPTATFTVTPVTGVSPVTPTATWSSVTATSCTASGGWSGVKATSGTEVLPPITAGATYTLVCSGGTGQAILTWVAPTTRTDGTALTNLAAYNIYYGTTATALILKLNKLAPATTHTFTGLAPGPHFYTLTAVDSAGRESAQTAPPVSKTVPVQITPALSVAVAVTPAPPVPPASITIAAVQGVSTVPVYVVTTSGNRSSAVAGFVDLGIPCSGPRVFSYRSQNYKKIVGAGMSGGVDPIYWWKTTPTSQAAAPCS